MTSHGGPVGTSRLIGKEFFANYAKEHSLEMAQDGSRGLIQNFRDLCPHPEVAAGVRDFYEKTSDYELDVWSEWHALFRPFGRVLAALFSRRLQQLNVPLSSLDTSRGITSAVLQLREPWSGRVVQTAWVRELVATKNTLYAGSYSVCHGQDAVRTDHVLRLWGVEFLRLHYRMRIVPKVQARP